MFPEVESNISCPYNPEYSLLLDVSEIRTGVDFS
jgi:hypothetical protein